MNMAYYHRRLEIWFERRRLTLAKTLVWLAKKIYAGEWRPPSIYDVSYGVLSQHLKVRNAVAEHSMTPQEMHSLGNYLPNALENHRQAMMRKLIDTMLENNIVSFTRVQGVDRIYRYRAEIKVVERPTDITAVTW